MSEQDLERRIAELLAEAQTAISCLSSDKDKWRVTRKSVEGLLIAVNGPARPHTCPLCSS